MVKMEINFVVQQWQVDLFMCIDMNIFNQNAIRGSMTMSICIYIFVDMATCVKDEDSNEFHTSEVEIRDKAKSQGRL